MKNFVNSIKFNWDVYKRLGGKDWVSLEDKQKAKLAVAISKIEVFIFNRFL